MTFRSAPVSGTARTGYLPSRIPSNLWHLFPRNPNLKTLAIEKTHSVRRRLYFDNVSVAVKKALPSITS